MRSVARTAPLLLALLLDPGCGGASGPAPATHDDFRAIQRREATLDAHLPDATGPGRRCEVACPAAAEVCAAAEGICAIARDTSDLDALDRCRAAERSCRRARTATSSRCGCEAGGAP